MGDISIIVKSAIDKVVISGGATALYWWCWSHQTHIDEIKHEPPNNILTSGWPWTRITVVDIPGFHLEPSCICHVALMIGIALLESSSNLPIHSVISDLSRSHKDASKNKKPTCWASFSVILWNPMSAEISIMPCPSSIGWCFDHPWNLLLGDPHPLIIKP